MVDETEEDGLTRRDAMKGAGTVAAASLVSKFSTSPAMAQTGTEPRIALGGDDGDWEIDDYDDGSGNLNLRIRHTPSGSELVYNVTAGEWEMEEYSLSNQSAARCYLSTEQSLAASTSFTQVNIDTATFDVRGELDATNNQITVDKAGIYSISGVVGFKNLSADDDVTARLKAGGVAKAQQRMSAGGNSAVSLFVNTLVDLAAGDSVVLLARNINSSCAIVAGDEQTNIVVNREA